MPFQTFCDNKGCMKEQTPALDLDTNNVHCGECNRPIGTVTEFAKQQMKSLGQIIRKKKAQSAYVVKCQKCNVENTPKLFGDELVCASCSTKLNLSPTFERLVRTAIKG